MKLQEALLCIDCETLYSDPRRCPHCGSRVSFPLSRALNRPAVAADLRVDPPAPRRSARELVSSPTSH